VFCDKTGAMKKKQVIDRSGVALSRCPIFLWMAPPSTSYQPARIPDETPAATKRNDSRQRLYCFEFGISLELLSAIAAAATADGTWNLELFPRSCKSLILLIIANNYRKLLGKKKIFMPQSKIRPGAASKEFQTRADSRRKYLIPHLSALIRALFKKLNYSPANHSSDVNPPVHRNRKYKNYQTNPFHNAGRACAAARPHIMSRAHSAGQKSSNSRPYRSKLMLMSAVKKTIRVDFDLRVFFTEHAFDAANLVLKQALAGARTRQIKKVLLVLDESLAQAQPALAQQIEHYFAAHSDTVKLVCPPLIIEGGERTKNSDFHVAEIHSQIDRYHIDRHSYVVAVGGGALLDMVGFAAATAHRGIRHVRIPTTTLSQADSGVGVKNGINAFGKKNFIGAFAPPFAVINDFHLLASLSPRDKRAGYVEAVKVALIRDRLFFETLERDAAALRDFEPAAMRQLIRRCAELHLEHIATSGDPFEFGAARPLDFGHWSAHKLEQLSEYQVRHGEAVAIGIALDVIYSRLMGFLDAASAERVLRLLETLGFELFASELLHVNSQSSLLVLDGLEEFREHLGGELTITLLKQIGQGFEIHEMNLPKVVEALYELKQRHERGNRKIIPSPLEGAG
jgi:3-dehydroquinate synthase